MRKTNRTPIQRIAKLTALLLPGLLAGGIQAAEIEHKKPGELIPDVQVRQADGDAIALREAVADQASVLVFYREDHGIDLEDSSGETHHLLPHPAVFVVTTDGKIHFAHVDPDYRTRLSGAEILQAAREALRPNNP